MKISRRDQVAKLRDEDGLSWRQIGERLNVPAMTAYNSYHTYRTTNVPGNCRRKRSQRRKNQSDR